MMAPHQMELPQGAPVPFQGMPMASMMGYPSPGMPNMMQGAFGPPYMYGGQGGRIVPTSCPPTNVTEMNSGSRPENGPKLSPLVKFCRALGITPEEKTFVERMWTRLGDLGIVLDAQVRGDGHRVTLSSLQYGELWVHYEDATTYRWERHIVTTDTLSIKHALFMAKQIALFDLDEIRVAGGLTAVDVSGEPSETRFYSWYKPPTVETLCADL